MRELSSLIGLQVISTSEGKKLGSIAEAYVDLAAGELVCVTLAKTPELRVVLAEDLDVIGSDAVMISDREKLRSREDVEEQLERGKRVLSSPPLVITSQGRTLGQLGSVQIDEATKKVIRFEVTGGAFKDLTEGVLALPVLDGVVHGDDTVIVPHDVVARRLVQAGGLRGALRNFGERLKVSVEDIGEKSRDQSVKLKERAGELAKKTAEATEKAKERMGEVADDARERISEVAEDAREAISHEDAQETIAAPDSEPDSPRIEDATAEAADEAVAEAAPPEETDAGVETAPEPAEEAEMHLVPETATPLPSGEESEEAAASDEDAAGDKGNEETG